MLLEISQIMPTYSPWLFRLFDGITPVF